MCRAASVSKSRSRFRLRARIILIHRRFRQWRRLDRLTGKDCFHRILTQAINRISRRRLTALLSEEEVFPPVERSSATLLSEQSCRRHGAEIPLSRCGATLAVCGESVSHNSSCMDQRLNQQARNRPLFLVLLLVEMEPGEESAARLCLSVASSSSI